MPSPTANPPLDLASFLSLGVSLTAATCDAQRKVELTRCAVARLAADGRVYVGLPLPEGQQALANIERTGLIALSAALPSNYVTRQLKGRDARRVAWPELRELAQLHRKLFVESLVELGWPGSYPAALWSLECAAIAFTPFEIFNQTPGPGAGLRVTP